MRQLTCHFQRPALRERVLSYPILWGSQYCYDSEYICDSIIFWAPTPTCFLQTLVPLKKPRRQQSKHRTSDILAFVVSQSNIRCFFLLPIRLDQSRTLRHLAPVAVAMCFEWKPIAFSQCSVSRPENCIHIWANWLPLCLLMEYTVTYT